MPTEETSWLELVQKLGRRFMEHVPHNQALGIRLERFDADGAWMTLPYDPRLVGNPETGVLHGGAITSLMDACCGAAVYTKLEELARIATLDLRIDYLRPATPSRDVVAHATCYKVTRNVGFVRCLAYHDDPADALASAAATFMILRSEQKEGAP